MAERTSYAPGTPSWIDLGSPDTAEAAAFYGGLFGWEAVMEADPQAGGYGMYKLRGKNVAGLGPQQNPEMPPFWTVYITVDDTDATAAAVTDAGGNVIMAPMDVMDAGRMAVLQDPLGSFFSVWQPKEHIGAELANEANTFVWTELATTDKAKSTAFYTKVFGWALTPTSGDAGDGYTVNGEMVCGAHTAGPQEFPAWSVWFAVDDCDASAAKAAELGGTVVMAPNEMDFGRAAMVADPHGAVFGIAKMKPQP